MENGYTKSRAAHSKKKGKNTAAKILGVTAIFLVALIVLMISPREYVVKGLSMSPTLSEGDNLHFTRYEQPGYGDVIVFDSGNDEYGLIVKRVIAMEGDTVSVNADGTVILNGEALEESYIELDDRGNSAMDEVTVEAGMLFVMGDNRGESIDSRDARIGQVSVSSVLGTVTSSVRSFN